MDPVRLADLKSVDIALSSSRNTNTYFAQDLRSGQIFEFPKKIAMAFMRTRAATARGTAKPEEHELKSAFAAMYLINEARRHKVSTKKKFNPLFYSKELFRLERFAPLFTRMADVLIGRHLIALFGLVALFAFYLGAGNDWAITSVFDQTFSLQALTTFALIAPILKIVHEFGHILVAHKFGVPVRSAGILLIGFYPMPFVDISDADFKAGRPARMLIASAGIFVDVFIALIAMILWHVSEGAFLQTLLGNIFIFGTVNSILFNANPLIKLDGYFVFADAIGERNLNATAGQTARNMWRKISTFGFDGSWPRTRRETAIAAYGIGAFVYKINILVFIVWQVFPKFLGLGVALVVWGLYVSFFSPLFSDKISMTNNDGSAQGKRSTINKRRAAFFGGAAVTVLILGFFVERSPRILLPLAPAVSRSYSLEVETSGEVSFVAAEGQVSVGDRLLVVENGVLQDRMTLQRARIEQAQLGLEAVRGSSQSQTRVGESQLEMVEAQLQLSIEANDGLVRVSKESGWFVAADNVRNGAHLAEGAVFGRLFPDGASTLMTTELPEDWVDRFEAGNIRAQTRMDGVYETLPPDTKMQIVETVSLDVENGQRSFTLLIELEGPAAHLKGGHYHVLLFFEQETLWEHAKFWLSQVRSRFRSAQISDRLDRLGAK